MPVIHESRKGLRSWSTGRVFVTGRGSASCHRWDCSGDEARTEEEDAQGPLADSSQGMVETITDLLLRLLVIQSTYWRTSKIQVVDSKTTVTLFAFQSVLFPFDVLLWPSYCSLAVPAEGRQGKGEESYITADELESSGNVKGNTSILDY